MVETQPNPAIQKLYNCIDEKKTLVCVGLDSDFAKLPAKFLKSQTPQLDFNKWIIDQTQDLTAAYKFNLAFYEARGEAGWAELTASVKYLHDKYPGIFLIADAKRGDIDNTNQAYATAIFDELGFDAVTVHPYLGKESLAPFLNRKDKVTIVLCRTSNAGAGEIQDLMINDQPLWGVVAQKVAEDWNANHNCMLVTGGTYPSELASIREIVGDQLDFLVPGIGSQGGEVKEVMAAALNSQGAGLLITASRSIIFAPDPRQAAQDLVAEIEANRPTK